MLFQQTLNSIKKPPHYLKWFCYIIIPNKSMIKMEDRLQH